MPVFLYFSEFTRTSQWWRQQEDNWPQQGVFVVNVQAHSGESDIWDLRISQLWGSETMYTGRWMSPEDGHIMFLQHAGIHLLVYMLSKPRITSSEIIWLLGSAIFHGQLHIRNAQCWWVADNLIEDSKTNNWNTWVFENGVSHPVSDIVMGNRTYQFDFSNIMSGSHLDIWWWCSPHTNVSRSRSAEKNMVAAYSRTRVHVSTIIAKTSV
jgi:hypothetical protein